MKGKRVLSGIQPSGHLHLGNYFGMMQRMIEYQQDNELFVFLVNYHALTSMTDKDRLKKNTLEAACDFLALGLNPDKSVFWVQSDVPEVTELTWLLSNVTNVGLLERAHSYKDKIARGATPNHGLFSYPVLMAADILLFGGEMVPVGKDQKQHLEISRDIALRFNATYGDTFIVPEPLIEESRAVIPGTDGQKMSKSYGNTIDIFCEKDDLAGRVMGIVTDPIPVDRPKNAERSILFQIYSFFLDPAGVGKLKDRFLAPGLKYSDVKHDLIEVIWNYFRPYRETRRRLSEEREGVIEVLKEGAEKARNVAKDFLKRARDNVGLNYWD